MACWRDGVMAWWRVGVLTCWHDGSWSGVRGERDGKWEDGDVGVWDLEFCDGEWVERVEGLRWRVGGEGGGFEMESGWRGWRV
jgi:hypothetical protein